MANQTVSITNNNKPAFWLFRAFGTIIRVEQSAKIRTKSQAESKAIQIAKGVISD